MLNTNAEKHRHSISHDGLENLNLLINHHSISKLPELKQIL